MAVPEAHVDAAPSPNARGAKPSHPEGSADESEAGPDETPKRHDPPPWSKLWQVPTILVSVGLIIGGLSFARKHRPDHDFDGALDRIRQLVDIGKLEAAADHLENDIAPHLAEATDVQRGRFSALTGDVLALSMQREQVWTSGHLRSVVNRYERAEELGFELTPARAERSANALLRLGSVADARRRIDDLELLTGSREVGEEALRARNRVLRRLIAHSLQGLPFEDAEELLRDYRDDPIITPIDDLWAAARFAELRLDARRPREAINHLLLDMRRLESRYEFDQKDFGLLYVLLARAYADLGEFEFGLDQVNLALQMVDENDPVRADGLVVLGRTLAAESRFEEALDAYTTVVEQFPGTRAYPEGLFGRAEIHGVLGSHEQSQSDFRELAQVLATLEQPIRITPDHVVTTLGEQRHDAALATQNLPLALDYIELTLLFFEPAEMPEPALRRLASTHRAIAEELLADVRRSAGRPVDFRRLDPAVRDEASRHFRQAGVFFVDRAQALESSPTQEIAWAASIWLAADSFDQAGYYDEAVRFFGEYIAGRSPDDPRWIEAEYRLAQCEQATLDYAAAAQHYEEIITDYPKTLWAMRSHVPLAACYVALDQPVNAERQLRQIVSGGGALKPASMEYRDALIALGTLLYDTDQYKDAIEELSKASRYYEHDFQITEIRFRLGDSYRRNAEQIGERLAAEPMAESHARELEVLREAHLREAKTLFARVVDAYDTSIAGELDELERDYLRFARFYRADCAFALKEYPEAIELYDRAAQAYSEHPASLVALIQIVNAYIALGDEKRAETAHHRALLRLGELPESVLSAPDAVFDRGAWERWLEALPPGIAMTRATEQG